MDRVCRRMARCQALRVIAILQWATLHPTRNMYLLSSPGKGAQHRSPQGQARLGTLDHHHLISSMDIHRPIINTNSSIKTCTSMLSRLRVDIPHIRCHHILNLI